MTEPIHMYHRVLLLRPERIRESLERVERRGLVERVPNLWQVGLGVARMWHRLVFRSDTIGTCRTEPARRTLRARILALRPVRLPVLLAERAVAPLDFSGLASDPERIVRHLLGAHHDGLQLAYDLSILSCHDGWLERLRDRVRDVVESDTPRSRWLRDLVVFEGYHERLLAAVEEAIARGRVDVPEPEANDPDIAFEAYLAWCAAQPPTPRATWDALRALSRRRA